MELIQIKSMKCVCVGKKYNYVSKGKNTLWWGGILYANCKKETIIVLLCMPRETPCTMFFLGRYHCQDIYQWQGSFCSFHPFIKCFFKGCKSDMDGFTDKLKYPGGPNQSADILKS